MIGVEPLVMVAMRAVKPAPARGSVKAPCECCAAEVWLSPASVAKRAEVPTRIVCVGCAVASGMLDAIDSVTTSDAQEREVLEGTGRSIQEILGGVGLDVRNSDRGGDA